MDKSKTTKRKKVKLKGLIAELKSKREKIKARKDKIGKKIDGLSSKKGKKKKIKELNQELKEVLKFDKNLKLTLKSKKAKVTKLIDDLKTKKLKKKDKKVSANANKKVTNKTSKKASEKPLPAEEIQQIEPNEKPALNGFSRDVTTREAIRYLRTLSTIDSLDLYVSGEKRITVLRAFAGRKNAIDRLEVK